MLKLQLLSAEFWKNRVKEVMSFEMKNLKADALRMIWFEFLASNPMMFKRNQMVDGQMADFYSDTIGLAIFVDGCDSKEKNMSSSVRKLYLTSKQICEKPMAAQFKIECRIRTAQLY